MISVVVPSYNEEENISAAARAICRALEGVQEYELIFVDDGSHDQTWKRIVEASEEDSRIRGLRLSRNFGKEAAIRAGLEAASGEAVILIDCDLQHPPSAIPEMIKRWSDGAEVVEGKKTYRGRESKPYGFLAGIFNAMMSKITGLDMSGASDFMLLDRKAVDAVLSYGEKGSFFRSLAQYVGFETTAVYYEVGERERGKSKFTFGKLFRAALEDLSSFTAVPLFVSLFAGVLTALAAVVLLILGGFGVTLGSFSAAAAVLMLIGGLILLALGAVGYYLARIYEEVKRRPRYIISRDTGSKGK